MMVHQDLIGPFVFFVILMQEQVLHVGAERLGS